MGCWVMLPCSFHTSLRGSRTVGICPYWAQLTAQEHTLDKSVLHFFENEKHNQHVTSLHLQQISRLHDQKKIRTDPIHSVQQRQQYQ